MKISGFILLFVSLGIFQLFINLLNGQLLLEWDDLRGDSWLVLVEWVFIFSMVDSIFQKVYYFKSVLLEFQLFIVSFYIWSGDYNQCDWLVEEIINKNWNYIYFDFCGLNICLEVCGSFLVIVDLEDVIQYVIDQGGVDINVIYIIGVSGGGYVMFLMYWKSWYFIWSFLAWVFISNLEDWYWFFKSWGLKYVGYLEAVIQSDFLIFNVVEVCWWFLFFMNIEYLECYQS